MSQQNVIKQLQENLKLIYHRAVDADKQLEQLRKTDKGKFAQIFSNDSAFKVHADTFLPYVEELAANLQAIQTDNADHYQTLLPPIIVKIELMFKTLNAFKESMKK